jgi:hypothetical protein
MKYRWRDGKVQAISYVSELGRCAVLKEADSLHKLYLAILEESLATLEVLRDDSLYDTKYRWRDGKAQAIAYVPALGRCAVLKEADSLHELYLAILEEYSAILEVLREADSLHELYGDNEDNKEDDDEY